MAVQIGLIRKMFIVVAIGCSTSLLSTELTTPFFAQETITVQENEAAIAATSALNSEIEKNETFHSESGKAFLELLNSDVNVNAILKNELLVACVSDSTIPSSIKDAGNELAASLNPELFKAISQAKFFDEQRRNAFNNAYSNGVRTRLTVRAEQTFNDTKEQLELLDATRVFANSELKQVKKDLAPANELLAFVKHRIAHMQRLQKQVPPGSGIQKDGQLYTSSDFKKLVAERKEQLVGQEEMCKLLEKQNQFLRKFYKQIKSDVSDCKTSLGQQETNLQELKTKQRAFSEATANTDDEESISESALVHLDELNKLFVTINQACNDTDSKLELISQKTAQSKEQYEAIAKATKRQSSLKALDDLEEIEDK